MNTTAKQMVEWIIASMNSLAVNPAYGSKAAVYRELSEVSGLSYSRIMQLDQGKSSDLKASTIDKLVDAVKQALRKAAA